MKMKLVLICLLTMLSGIVNGQNRQVKDSIIGEKFLKKELSSLNMKVLNNIITYYDNSGKVLIIWKDDHRYKVLKTNYKTELNSDKQISLLSKKKSIKVDRLIDKIEQVSISKSDCIKNAHSFIKVFFSVKSASIDISNSFYTHCVQSNKIAKSLIDIYFELRE
ncbi:exported hypothetical protein [Tenacibaculum litopenaei]|uniref:hypothetical protein n=1 Tax=Tenacibaculum litopenaei TaxID=396016 RepID=UPI0038939101